MLLALVAALLGIAGSKLLAGNDTLPLKKNVSVASRLRVIAPHPHRKKFTAEFGGAEEFFHHMNRDLYEALMKNYTKDLSPYYTNHHVNLSSTNWQHPDPMTTHLSLIWARIVKLDQVEQVMRIIAEFRMIWNDYRLRWKPSDYGGIEHIYLNRASVWTPEITIANSEMAADTIPEYKQNVMVNSTGHVIFYNAVLSNSVCELNTTDFPFDNQSCDLTLLETFFNSKESVIDSEVGPRFKFEFTGNGEWEVINLSRSRESLPQYDKVDFTIIRYKFELKRKANFYVMVIIIPTFIITFLTITGIFGKQLTADDYIGELSLGLTSMMTFTVMLGIVADWLPKTDHLPVLSIFLTVDVSLMAISILLVILHPRVLYPRFRKIRSKVFRQDSNGEKTCCGGLLPSCLAAYTTSNIMFLVLFQGINIGNLWYILSFWN